MVMGRVLVIKMVTWILKLILSVVVMLGMETGMVMVKETENYTVALQVTNNMNDPIEIQVYEGDGVEPEEIRKHREEMEHQKQIEQRRQYELEKQMILTRRLNAWNINNDYGSVERSNLCPCCHQVRDANEIQYRMLNTAYSDPASNWLLSCVDCYDESIAFYRDQWDEYYASVGC